MAEISNPASWFSKNKILIILLSSVIVVAGIGIPLYFVFKNNGTYTDVTVQEASVMINDDVTFPNLVIVDVRTPSEFGSGHIPDAINIVWYTTSYNDGESALESYKHTEILVYCQTGSRSRAASQYLANQGFTKIYNMLEGYTAWLDAQPSVQHIDVHEAKSMIDDNTTYPDLIVLDIREDWEFASGHLEDAWWIQWNRTLETYEGGESILFGYEDTDIIVYCRTGSRSVPGSQFFIDLGFTKIYNMLGGIVAWEAAEYAVVTT